MNRLAANSLLLLAGAIWGMGFVAQSTAMQSVGPWTYTALKFLLATLVVLPFAWRERARAAAPVARADRLGFLLTGMLLFAAAILQQIGILSTSVTNSGFLTGLYVVLTPVLVLLIFRTAPHWVVWPAALLAFAGIALLGGGQLSALTVGDGLTVFCAVFWSFQILCVGRFAARSGRPLTLSAAQFAIAAGVAGAGALLLEPQSFAALWEVWPEIVYGGVFSSGLAFTLQTIGQRYTTAPQAAILLSSEALFAAAFAAVLLGERLPPVGLFGCAMIFAAMLAVELVPMRGAKSGKALAT